MALVYVAPSRIVNAGLGLFAKKRFKANDFICYYSGTLVDYNEAIYINPTYIVSFELGRGLKLVGDSLQHLGLYANSVRSDCADVVQNARFNLATKQSFTDGRGMFSIVATRDIARNEEIIVDYGLGYWNTLRNWNVSPPVKSKAVIERDERALARSIAKAKISPEK